jgi:hypothetical protein
LGGEFEAVMSSDVLIAEHSAKRGLPEILFNQFSGMGAYSLLSCQPDSDSACAEWLTLSETIYGAEELYDTGFVDALAEDLQGEMAVYDYVCKENRGAIGARVPSRVKLYTSSRTKWRPEPNWLSLLRTDSSSGAPSVDNLTEVGWSCAWIEPALRGIRGMTFMIMLCVTLLDYSRAL